jgi:mono/diheme cytochrome c family protein
MKQVAWARNKADWIKLSLGLFGVIGVACNDTPVNLPGDEGVGAGPTASGGSSGTGAGVGGAPIDSRPVVTAASTPPPISGGTLLALREGGLVVASDPDRDRIVVVSAEQQSVVEEIVLAKGSEPGRAADDAAGRVHVVLRGRGAVLSLVAATGEVLEERSVCRAPRGIAFDAANDALVVACLEGTLVELPAAGGEAFRSTAVATDLRDVVFLGTTLVATRFRSAEVLYLDEARNIVNRSTPLAGTDLAATTAWRAVPTPDGDLLIAHQRALTTPVGISDPGSGGASGAAGTGGAPSGGADPRTSSGYGSAFDPCSSIVQGTTSTASPDGTIVTSQTLPGVGLPVDVAVSNSGLVAIANGSFVADTVAFSSADSISIFPRASLSSVPQSCGRTADLFIEMNSTTTALAFDSSGRLFAQTRNPSRIHVYEANWAIGVIELGGADVSDTGHEIFHADTGGGVACASCHAEGTDDGHVWNFTSLGLRRTQPLDVGLEGLAPFHWDGELASFTDLVHEVFERRMGGPIESNERIAALEHFVYGLKRRPPVRPADDAAALRGKALFESTEIECASCHTGPKLTNGETKDIGRGFPGLQVPSLIGVSTRTPLMHDGCAATLRDRFDPVCGGTLHGHAELLDDAELDDLVAYLETL